MPDNMALCCGVWSIALFSGYLNSGKLAHVVLSSVFFCLAVLAKLPFIIYGVVIFSYLLVMLIRKERSVRQLTGVGLIYLAGVLIALSWYATVIPHWVIGAVHGVFDQSQNHPDLAYVIQRTIIAILPELIINYGSVLFFLIGFYFIFSLKLFRKVQVLPFTFLGLSLLAYFTYEMNIIDVVHDYYLFPFLMPVFLIVAYGAFKLLSGKLKMLKIVTEI